MNQKDLYISELIFNLSRFVQPNITSKAIETLPALPEDCYLSQNIVGGYSAYTAIFGEEEALRKFAEIYSKFEIDVFDDLAKEVIVDFLNLINGIFIVDLSSSSNLESTLEPPAIRSSAPRNPKRTNYVVPIVFDFGIVNFVLSE